MIGFEYPPDQNSVRFLQRQPFEHRWRYPESQRFLNRILIERSFHEGIASRSDGSRFELIVIVLNGEGTTASLENTLRSVALQSCPNVRCVLDSVAGNLHAQILESCRRKGMLPKTFTTLTIDQALSELAPDTFMCFVRPGDVLHPSLAHAISIRSDAQRADVIVWNDVERSGPHAFTFCRRPPLERHTLRVASYIGRSFAFRGALLRGYAGSWLEEARRNQFHLLQLWLSEQDAVSWASEFDFLLAREEGPSFDESRLSPRYSDDEGRYRDFHRTYWADFEFQETGSETQPYRLLPLRRPETLGVVVPFRDRPDLTIRAALSALRQVTSFPVDVTLVNNRSAPSSVRDLREGLDREGFADCYTIVDYDASFNHSAECNLGARSSDAEVFVMLNNDAFLVAEKALEEMGAWALVPNVATVGLRVGDAHGSLICAGLRLRYEADPRHSSPMEEQIRSFLADWVRETAGNTFAAVAVEAKKLRELGWLDAVSFPNGFNDVEFCLRAREAGYVHMYLGHLRAVHLKGQSRRTSDEVLQILKLRQKYPSAAGWALAQLEIETRQEPAGFFTRRLWALSRVFPTWGGRRVW